MQRLWPRSLIGRVMLVLALAVLLWILISILFALAVRNETPAVTHADAAACPSARPGGNDTGIRVMYQGVCTPVLSEATKWSPSSPPPAGMFPTAAMPATSAVSNYYCGFGDVLSVAGQTVASIGVLEPFTLEPYSNLDNFPGTPAVSTTITPLGQTFLLSTNGTSFYAYGSATFSPGIYSEITVLGTWVLDQLGVPGGPAVNQWTDALVGYIESTSAAYPDPCSAVGPDGKQAGQSWSLSVINLAEQVATTVWNALSAGISWAWDQTIWSLCGLFGGSC